MVAAYMYTSEEIADDEEANGEGEEGQEFALLVARLVAVHLLAGFHGSLAARAHGVGALLHVLIVHERLHLLLRRARALPHIRRQRVVGQLVHPRPPRGRRLVRHRAQFVTHLIGHRSSVATHTRHPSSRSDPLATQLNPQQPILFAFDQISTDSEIRIAAKNKNRHEFDGADSQIDK